MKNKLYGAILGDLCGQPFEFKKNGYNKPIVLHNVDSHFTDDTIMTLATAFAIMENITFEDSYKFFGRKYVGDYYGTNFKIWINEPKGVIGTSYGNGCLMRLSPIFYEYDDKLIRNAKVYSSCLTSHDNDESIYACKDLINLYDSTDKIQIEEPVLFEKFEVRCKPTIEFISKLFNNTSSTQEAILKAVSLGGDTDTNASIIGELCNYHYNDLSQNDIDYVDSKLDDFLLKVLKDFNNY